MPGSQRFLAAALAAGFIAALIGCRSVIDRNKTYRIGTDNSLPYHALNEQGRPEGFAVDVLEAAARRAGVRLEWVLATEGPGPAINSGAVDLWPAVGPAVTQRSPSAHLTAPWIRNSYALVARRDLKGGFGEIRTIATGPFLMPQRVASLLLAHAGQVVFPSRDEAWRAVCENKVDGAILEIRVIQFFSIQPPGGCSEQPLRVTGLDYPGSNLSIAAPPKSAAVADALRDEIEKMVESRELSAILEPWAYYNADDAQLIYRENLNRRNTLLAYIIAGVLLAAGVLSALQWRRNHLLSKAAVDAEQRLKRILSSIQEVVWSYSLSDQKLSYVSSAVEAVYGCTREESGGKSPPWREWIHPEDRDSFEKTFRRAAAGDAVSIEYRIRSPQRPQPRWILERLTPVIDSSGAVTRIDAAAMDVTARMEAELARKAGEERFRKLIEKGTDVIALADAEGRIVFISPSVADFIGYNHEEMSGLPVLQCILPEDVQAHQSEIQSVFRTPGAYANLELRVRHKDGSIRIAECRFRNLTNIEGVGGIVVNSRDITERRQAEQDKGRLIDELEARNAELERFAYTVSHDLKSPLITIRGYLGFIEEAAEKGDMEQCRADLTRLRHASGKMERMLGELLELSRVGLVAHPKEKVSFSKLAREAAALLKGELDASNARLEIDAAMPDVFVDPGRIVQVLQNLIENAVKFSESKPVIKIGVGDDDVTPVFFVKDNGIGIEPQYHSRIFELFEKLDPQSEGTGIGLSLVRRIIEMHGGKIWVESNEEAEGSTFCFTLPLAAVAPPVNFSEGL